MLGSKSGGVKKSRKTILGNSWKKLVIKKAHHQTSANLMDSLNPGHSPPVTPGVPSRLWCQPLVLLGVLVVARYVAPPPSDHDTQSVSGCKRGNGVNQSSPNISQTASLKQNFGQMSAFDAGFHSSYGHWHVIHAVLKYSRDDRTSADRSWQQVQCTSIWRSISSPRKTSYCRWAKASSICRPFITSSVRASPTNSCWSTVSVSHVRPRERVMSPTNTVTIQGVQ